MAPTAVVITFLATFVSTTWCMFIHNGVPIDQEGLQSVQINLNEYMPVGAPFQSQSGVTKFKGQQQYKGVDIYGATLVISDDSTSTTNNQLSAISGKYYETAMIASDFNDDVTPAISSESALQTAIQYYLPDGDETDLFGYAYGESARTTQIKLTLYKSEEDGIDHFTLSYIAEFTFQAPDSQDVKRAFAVIDAKTGEILHTFASMVGQNEAAWATGGNAKIGEQRHGPMPITASPDVSNVFVFVYDWISNSQQNLGQCEYDTPNFCEVLDYEVNTAPNCLGDAYKYGNIVFDLFEEWGPDGITPIHPDDMPLRFYVHYGNEFENAFFSGGAMYFGDGRDRFYPLISLDVTSHEVAHGFTRQGSNLRYSQQSGGINEAFSDLAGEAAEEFYRGQCDWLCGYDIFKDPNCANPWQEKCALRYLMDPPRDGNSIGRADDFVPNMNVHYSSGVYNKAWYRLYTQRGWSMQDIFGLTSLTNYYYWGENTNYVEGLCALLAAAEDYFRPLFVDLKQNDLQIAFGDMSWEGIDGPGVFCPTQQVSSDVVVGSVGGDAAGIGDGENTPDTDASSNGDQMYYVYGGIGAGFFAMVAVFAVVWCYRARTKQLKKQLNESLKDRDCYGSVVTDDEKQ